MNKVYIVRVDNQEEYDLYADANLRAYLSKEEAVRFIEECKADFEKDDNRFDELYAFGMHNQCDTDAYKDAEDEMLKLETKWGNLTNWTITVGHDNPRWTIIELDLY